MQTMNETNGSTVVLAVCESYDGEEVYRALCAGIEALGGIGCFVSQSEKILVKPNFLSVAESDTAITTHPAVISAFCRILSENGYRNVLVGDSPAHGTCRAAVEKLRLTEKELYGARIAEMTTETAVPVPQGGTVRQLWFAREVLEADAIIGLSKMKTHALERITGAVKNMYGLICGSRKAAGHVKAPTAVRFARMLTEIHRAAPVRLHVMDAVVAMEGNGPASGTPVPMGFLLLSSDPVALDSVFCRLVNLRPELVPTNVQGELAGIGTFREERLRVLVSENDTVRPVSITELTSRFGKPDFDVQRGSEARSPLGLLSRVSGGRRRPVIDKEKCVRCGVCVEHCPVEGKAVRFVNGTAEPPEYDYSKCIRCYCCQELCPRHAISVK